MIMELYYWKHCCRDAMQPNTGKQLHRKYVTYLPYLRQNALSPKTQHICAVTGWAEACFSGRFVVQTKSSMRSTIVRSGNKTYDIDIQPSRRNCDTFWRTLWSSWITMLVRIQRQPWLLGFLAGTWKCSINTQMPESWVFVTLTSSLRWRICSLVLVYLSFQIFSMLYTSPYED